MSDKDNITLEGLLNEVDYSYFNQDYIPSVEALEFITFIKLVNGEEGEENKSPIIHMDMIDGANAADNNLYVSFRGSAKALAVDTLLMTPSGHLPMGDVAKGDMVIDRNGEPTIVTKTSRVFYNKTYKFSLSDGTSFIANEDHIHIVHVRTIKKVDGKNVNYFQEREMTTKELLARGVHYNRTITEKCPLGKEVKWYIPLINNPINYPHKVTPMDAYSVGAFLGDGNISKSQGMVTFTSHIDDMDEMLSYFPYTHGTLYADKRNTSTLSTRILGLSKLAETHLSKATCLDKSIPDCYLYNNTTTRLDLIRGLMDTDGTITGKSRCSYTSASESLAYGFLHLVKSIGCNASIKKYGNKYNGYYNVAFSSTIHNPFRLKRKANLWKPGTKYKAGVRQSILDITPTIDNVPSRCISVDSPTESYLIENSIITHNTTALHEYMFLYIATYGSFFDFGRVEVAMYVSDTIDNGVKSMRKNLEFRWQNSDFLQLYVPVAKFTDVRWEFTNKDGKSLCVRGFGASTGVRGFKEYGKRPTWLGMDDLMSDKNAESATIVKDIKNIIYKAARQAMHPKKRKIIWTGTPFNQRDPLYSAACSTGWNTKVYPICEEYPCAREEFRGAWEDRFNFDFVKNEYDTLLANGEISAFNQELMLRIMSDEDRLIEDHEINWYDRSKLIANKGAFNFYITTDFATSAQQHADFSVVSVWALNHKGFWFWVDGVCKKQTMDKSINDLFRLAQLYKPQSVGIEVSGQQGGFIPWIQDQMLVRNNFFNLASEGNDKKPGIRPNTNKMVRFNLVVPWFKSGLMWFPKEMKDTPVMQEFMNELTLVSLEGFKSKHDDCADTISMLPSLTVWKPSEELRGKEASDGIWEFDEDDLDESGLSSYVV